MRVFKNVFKDAAPLPCSSTRFLFLSVTFLIMFVKPSFFQTPSVFFSIFLNVFLLLYFCLLSFHPSFHSVSLLVSLSICPHGRHFLSGSLPTWVTISLSFSFTYFFPLPVSFSIFCLLSFMFYFFCPICFFLFYNTIVLFTFSLFVSSPFSVKIFMSTCCLSVCLSFILSSTSLVYMYEVWMLW